MAGASVVYIDPAYTSGTPDLPSYHPDLITLPGMCSIVSAAFSLALPIQ